METIKSGMERRIAEVKDGGKWRAAHCDQIIGEEVYKMLASDLSGRYLNKAQYIKSVKRVQHYTHQEIIVTFVEDVRARYILPAMF